MVKLCPMMPQSFPEWDTSIVLTIWKVCGHAVFMDFRSSCVL